MAEDIAGGGEAAKPPEAGRPRQGADGELPAVESPSLSPAGGEPETVPESAIVVLPPIAEAGTQAARPRFRLRSRHRRQAMLAAAVAIAAALGALATGGKGAAPAAAAGEQRAVAAIGQPARQGSGVLEARLAASRKSATSEVTKISDRLADRLRSAPDFAGSIKPPATIPTPPPRPPVLAAAAAPHVVSGWTIHDVRGHGDLYQVVPGAPPPRLGPVRRIERRDGRWVGVTPKGLIVSLRARGHFSRN